jgi:hypothetical protein
MKTVDSHPLLALRQFPCLAERDGPDLHVVCVCRGAMQSILRLSERNSYRRNVGDIKLLAATR